MKAISIGIGMVAGMAIATAAITCMYPDVPRRMLRDGKRMAHTTKKHFEKIMN